MWMWALRVIAAGLVVVVVSEIAQRWPRLAAILLFVPLIPPVVILFMHLQGASDGEVSRLGRQSLLLIPIGLLFFVPLAAAPALGWTFWPSFMTGLAMMTAGVGAYLWWS